MIKALLQVENWTRFKLTWPLLYMVDGVEKVDKMNLPRALSAPVLVYALLPSCVLLSALLRGLHYVIDAWAFGRERTCSSLKDSLR